MTMRSNIEKGKTMWKLIASHELQANYSIPWLSPQSLPSLWRRLHNLGKKIHICRLSFKTCKPLQHHIHTTHGSMATYRGRENYGGAWFRLTQKVNLFISQLSRRWSLRKHGHCKKGGKFVLLEGPTETRSIVCASMLNLSAKQAWECSHSRATTTSTYSSCSIHWYQHGFHRWAA